MKLSIPCRLNIKSNSCGLKDSSRAPGILQLQISLKPSFINICLTKMYVVSLINAYSLPLFVIIFRSLVNIIWFKHNNKITGVGGGRKTSRCL